MGWLIFLGVFALLSVLTLGVRILYDAGGASVILLLGPVKIRLYPGKKNRDKAEKPKKEQGKTASEKRGKKEKKGGSLRDFEKIVLEVLDLLVNFRRKLIVSHLELKVMLAGGDPADLAQQYGKSWIAIGNLMPQLERFFKIRKRDVAVSCSFVDRQTTVYGRLDIVMSLGRMLCLVLFHGSKILREYLRLMKFRKGGAKV